MHETVELTALEFKNFDISLFKATAAQSTYIHGPLNVPQQAN